jgi:membrane protease YdiL (CAAX protease family)
VRPLWLLLPAALMFGFQAALPRGLVAVYGGMDRIPPSVFYYLPFISPLFPLALLLVAVARTRSTAGQWFVVSTPGTRAGDALLGVGLGIVAVAIFGSSLLLLRRLGFAVPDFSAMSVTHHVFFATVGAVVPGIAEELYFRGFLGRELAGWKTGLVLLASSLSFASWHLLTPTYLPHTFLIGLLFGAAHVHTGRLLPPMVAHCFANMSAGVLILKGWV